MSRNLRDFTKAVYGFDAVVRRVPSERWDAASPCDGWTATDVVDHLCSGMGMITTMAGGEPSGPPVDDRTARWNAARDAVLDALDTQGALQREDDTPFGRMTVDRFIGIFGVDPLTHTWDLARAAGVDPALDEGLAERYERQLERAGDLIRGEGMFGPPVEPPEGAGPADRFIALAGRDPRHTP